MFASQPNLSPTIAVWRKLYRGARRVGKPCERRFGDYFFINSASFFAAASRPPSPKARANATAAPTASEPKA